MQPGVDAAVGPVAGENQVFVTAFIGAQPILVRAGDRQHVAIRRVDVDADVLGFQRRCAAQFAGAGQQTPGKSAFGDRSG